MILICELDLDNILNIYQLIKTFLGQCFKNIEHKQLDRRHWRYYDVACAAGSRKTQALQRGTYIFVAFSKTSDLKQFAAAEITSKLFE